MGLYAIDCQNCGKPFVWFSGNNPEQFCEECTFRSQQNAGNTRSKDSKNEKDNQQILESTLTTNAGSYSESACIVTAGAAESSGTSGEAPGRDEETTKKGYEKSTPEGEIK